MFHRAVFVVVLLVAGIHAQNQSSTVRPERPPRPAIYNGQPAAEGDIPFQAALFSPLTNDPGNGALCGGSLIRPNWVLTAAHCLVDTDNTQVGLGGVDRTSMPYQVTSTERFPHEDYNPTHLVNDVGLVKLPSNAEGQFISVVSMVSSGDLANLDARASGFGLTETGGISNQLLMINMRTITNEECVQVYNPNQVTNNTICATWVEDSNQNICQGDSGGPLSTVVNGEDVLIGVVSFGHPDGCGTGRPSGFSRTSAFQDWIERTIAANP